jgi:serine/threonine-protein kinase
VIPSFDAASMNDEEGRAFQQNRIGFLGKVGALFFLATACARWLVLASQPQPEELALRAGSQAFFAAAAALAAVWAACRWGRRSAAVLRRIDAASVLAAGTALASYGLTRPQLFDDTQPVVANVALLIVARGVIVPSSASRTLGVSLAAGLPALFTIVLKAAHEDWLHPLASASAVDTGIQAFWLLATIGLSVLASRVTYGLRAEVREARQVGQYTLDRKLGAGGMGVVYLARHSRLKRPTAVKLLSPSRVGQQAVERFEREVQITARLTHPNTVAVYDYGRTLDGVFYYAMEYLEGISLEKLVAAEGPQPPGRVVRILHQVAGALG